MLRLAETEIVESAPRRRKLAEVPSAAFGSKSLRQRWQRNAGLRICRSTRTGAARSRAASIAKCADARRRATMRRRVSCCATEPRKEDRRMRNRVDIVPHADPKTPSPRRCCARTAAAGHYGAGQRCERRRRPLRHLAVADQRRARRGGKQAAVFAAHRRRAHPLAAGPARGGRSRRRHGVDAPARRRRGCSPRRRSTCVRACTSTARAPTRSRARRCTSRTSPTTSSIGRTPMVSRGRSPATARSATPTSSSMSRDGA